MDSKECLGVLIRIADALEKQNEISKHQLQYAVDRDRVSFEFMERQEERDIKNTQASIILGES